MIRKNEILTVLHDDNSSFVDLTNSMADFTRGTSTVTVVSAEDSIYVGFYKPINSFFVEFSTANTNDVAMTVSFYNGSSFTDVSGVFDDTDGFQRSGFVYWDRNQTDEAKNTINSIEQYWYKLDFSGDTSAMVIRGLNIVFSDDQDLKRECFEVAQYLPENENSFILSHVAARDEIVQRIRARREFVKDSSNRLNDVNAFDLLELDQLKLASTYLALGRIFFAISEKDDDIYFSKSQSYYSMGHNIIETANISIDRDDDGTKDKVEDVLQSTGRIVRR